jgi:hypothetical protein
VIARLSYVVCDECCDGAPPGDDATEARALAQADGFVRRDGRDLCLACVLGASPVPGDPDPTQEKP